MKKITIPTEEENEKCLAEFFDRERKIKAERRQAVEVARPALERLCEVMRDRSGQCYKVRALLYSLWNGQATELIEILNLDWEIRKDLGAVFLAFGFEDQDTENRAGDFFYDEIKEAISKAGQWQWFIEAHIEKE